MLIFRIVFHILSISGKKIFLFYCYRFFELLFILKLFLGILTQVSDFFRLDICFPDEVNNFIFCLRTVLILFFVKLLLLLRDLLLLFKKIKILIVFIVQQPFNYFIKKYFLSLLKGLQIRWHLA